MSENIWFSSSLHTVIHHHTECWSIYSWLAQIKVNSWKQYFSKKKLALGKNIQTAWYWRRAVGISCNLKRLQSLLGHLLKKLSNDDFFIRNIWWKRDVQKQKHELSFFKVFGFGFFFYFSGSISWNIFRDKKEESLHVCMHGRIYSRRLSLSIEAFFFSIYMSEASIQECSGSPFSSRVWKRKENKSSAVLIHFCYFLS